MVHMSLGRKNESYGGKDATKDEAEAMNVGVVVGVVVGIVLHGRWMRRVLRVVRLAGRLELTGAEEKARRIRTKWRL